MFASSRYTHTTHAEFTQSSTGGGSECLPMTAGFEFLWSEEHRNRDESRSAYIAANLGREPID